MNKTIVLGSGCFWCIEAVFQQVKGVSEVVSGYAGGEEPDPTYRNHGTHAEVIQATYNESVVTLPQLLEIYFGTHDPTTTNQPDTADDGPSYRPIILCAEEEIAAVHKAKGTAQSNWDNPIITEIKVLDKFYPAEDYHQDFYNQNQGNPYCQVIINPKLAKFQKKFGKLIKD